MTDKYKPGKTGLPEENEVAELDREQLEQVAGGDRDGGHKPPTNPDK